MNTKKKRFEISKELYPKNVIVGVKESLKQADEGKLIPYKGIRNMLDL